MIRTITTSFYRRKELVHTNWAVHANRAVLRCVHWLQVNAYEATHAEIFDSGNGELHAVIKRHMNSDIEILFKREVKAEE
jgi:hypothetical protein